MTGRTRYEIILTFVFKIINVSRILGYGIAADMMSREHGSGSTTILLVELTSPFVH